MKYFIVGAGGFGRELLAWISKENPSWIFRGFLDDYKHNFDIVSKFEGHTVDKNSAYFVAIGDGKARVKLLNIISVAGGKTPSYVSSAVRSIADLNSNSGSLFLGNCSISNNNKFGRGVLVQAFACTGHDVNIGDGVTLGTHSFVAGNVTIRDFTTINPHASVAPGVNIGVDVTVGLGSMVIRNIPDSLVVFGSPAKILMKKK